MASTTYAICHQSDSHVMQMKSSAIWLASVIEFYPIKYIC